MIGHRLYSADFCVSLFDCDLNLCIKFRYQKLDLEL